MEQGVPGTQNEHFFELLHPNAARGPPPPPPPPPPPAESTSPVSSAEVGSPPQDPSPLRSITPSYDFQLTHASSSGEFSPKLEDAPPPVLHRESSVVPSGDHHQGSYNNTFRGLVYGKPVDASGAVDHVTMDAIDHTMKHYTNNLLQVLECVNGRLSQLETTVQGLEFTVAGLKAAEGEKQDQSNGRLMKLELLIEEVHRGVQLLHEKQRLDAAKAHLSNLNLDDQKSAVGGAPQSHVEGWQQPRSAKEDLPQAAYSEPPPQLPLHHTTQYPPPPQSHYPHTPPPPHMQPFPTSQSMLPSPSTMNTPPPNPQQFPQQHLPPQQPNTPQAPQPPPQTSLQIPSFHPVPQTPPPSSYNVPVEPTAYSHMQSTHHLALQPPPSSSYLPEPSQYSGGMHGGPRQPPMPQEVLHSSQQHNPVGSQHTYDPIPGRMGPMASSMSYAQPPPLPKPAPQVSSLYESGGSGGYGSSPYRAAQPVPSAPSGGGGYPRLPTAQPVQHGIPAASPISSGSATRSPLDDVVEKVCNMGFSREQVQRVIRHLTENGQSVELNAVLDKLMNGGDSPQPARGGWFNRG